MRAHVDGNGTELSESTTEQPHEEQLAGRARVIRRAFFGVLVAAIVLLAHLAVRQRSVLRCGNQLRSIHHECAAYASEHAGHFPDQWSDLRISPGWCDIFICPASGSTTGRLSNINAWCDYVLVPNVREDSPDTMVLAFEPLSNHRGRGAHVLFVSGIVRWCKPEEHSQLVGDRSSEGSRR